MFEKYGEDQFKQPPVPKCVPIFFVVQINCPNKLINGNNIGRIMISVCTIHILILSRNSARISS